MKSEQEDKKSKVFMYLFGVVIVLLLLISLFQIKISHVSNLPIDDNTGNVNVLNSDIYFEIAKGNVDNHSGFFKFGANPSVGATEEVIWDGSDSYTFLETCDTLNISSSSVNDNGYIQNTGAWNIFISGLDENYTEISEFITLNGTSVVTTSQCFLRTFRAQIYNSGAPSPTGDANEGTITIETSSLGIDQAFVLPSNGQTLMTLYTCPANATCYVTGVNLAVGEGKQATIKAKLRQCTNTTICSFANKYSIDLYQSAFYGPLQVFFEVPEKTDAVFTATSSSSGTSVTASFGVIKVNN